MNINQLLAGFLIMISGLTLLFGNDSDDGLLLIIVGAILVITSFI